MVPLEQDKGWNVAIARPGENPTDAFFESVIRRVFPSPSRETQAIRHFIQAAKEAGLEEQINASVSLAQIRNVYDEQQTVIESHKSGKKRNKAKLFLSNALNLSVEEQADPTTPPAASHRFLDLSNGRRLATQYCGMILHQARLQEVELEWPRTLNNAIQIGDAIAFAQALSELSLGEYSSFLDGVSVATVWSTFEREKKSLLNVDDPQSLVRLLSRISKDCLDFSVLTAGEQVIEGPKGLLIVLDQFEEMFTRFSYSERETFFDQLEAFYEASRGKSASSESVSMVHLLVSMRDEHVADLDRIRNFNRDISANTFHLRFIQEQYVRDTIEEPARRFGFEIEEEIPALLINELRRDDGTIHPVLVQIVLAHVWAQFGGKITNAIEHGDDAVFQKSDYTQLGSAGRALVKHIETIIDGANTVEFGDKEPPNEVKQYLLMDMLERLSDGSGFRVIIEESKILSPNQSSFDDEQSYPQDPDLRRLKILDYAVKSGLVRRYSKLSQNQSAKLVEITHENLIHRINEVLDVRLRGDRALRYVHSALGRIYSNGVLRDSRKQLGSPLSAMEVDALDRFAEWISLDKTQLEIAFRSALMSGVREDVVIRFAERLDQANESTWAGPQNSVLDDRIQRDLWIERAALDVVLEKLQAEPNSEQTEFFLRSMLEESLETDVESMLEFGAQVRSWND